MLDLVAPRNPTVTIQGSVADCPQIAYGMNPTYYLGCDICKSVWLGTGWDGPLEGFEGLRQGGVGGGDAGDHEGAAVAAQGLLQQRR